MALRKEQRMENRLDEHTVGPVDRIQYMDSIMDVAHYE